MTEPKGITLKGLDEHLSLVETPVFTKRGGKEVPLTRKLAVTQALETHSDAKKEDKFLIFDLGLRFRNANGSVEISAEESVLIKSALEPAWPQPGLLVPLCRWLEGELGSE